MCQVPSIDNLSEISNNKMDDSVDMYQFVLFLSYLNWEKYKLLNMWFFDKLNENLLDWLPTVPSQEIWPVVRVHGYDVVVREVLEGRWVIVLGVSFLQIQIPTKLQMQ